MSSKNCPRCGHASPSDALFCPRCGNSLKGTGADPLVGTVIADRYLLVEKIGQGNSGTIYRSEHTTLRKRVAVKVLHHELSKDEGAIERFRREATTVGEIDNEHIAQVLDFGRAADGRLFFAMEFLDGETLTDVLKREGRLPVQRAIDLIAQVGDALGEAHALGYIHRDLRPRNVMLTKKRGKSDFVKLLDFGLSKLVLPSETAKPGVTSMLSIADPRYMAPELLRGEPAERRSDIWSLGVILYEMLAGAPPYEGAVAPAVLAKIGVAGAPPSLRARQPEVPEWLDKVVAAALSRSPEQRFVTVLKLTECLASQRAPVIEAPVENKPAPVENKPAPVENKPAPVENRPAPVENRPAPVENKPAQAGGQQQFQPFASKKSRKQQKADQRRAEEQRRSETSQPTRAEAVSKAPATQIAAVVPVATNPPPAEPQRSATAQAVAAGGATASGETGTDKPTPAPASMEVPSVEIATDLTAPSSDGKRDEQPRGEAKRNGFERRESKRMPAVGSSQTGEHERIWFGEGSSPKPLVDEESFEEPPGRKNRGLVIGLAAGGLVVAGVLAVAAWPREHKKEEAVRSYDSPARSESLKDKEGAENAAAGKGEKGAAATGESAKAADNLEPKEAQAAVAKQPEVAAREPEKAAEPSHAKEPERKAEPVKEAREARKSDEKRVEKPARLEPKPEPAAKEAAKTTKTPEGFRDPFSPDAAKQQAASVELLLKSGRQKLNAGDIGAALGDFKRAKDLDSRNAEAVAGLGEVAFEQGDYTAASNQLKQAVRLAPHKSRFQVLLGQAYYKLDNFAGAAEQCGKVMKAEPGNEEAKHCFEAAQRKLGQ